VFLRRRIVLSVGYVGGNVIQLMSMQCVSSPTNGLFSGYVPTNCRISGYVGGNAIHLRSMQCVSSPMNRLVSGYVGGNVIQ
jgi:hypothetical protein